ncbi:hypothetical protein SEA_FULCRUM_6 [Gordonia phage Fulcrum]|uniref:Uncharacterized protein n=1 Tax=Gordonia phage Fulcrum TaxID=3077818 RepID=A0AA96KMH3_9CAUD|nr:hypothetical protein SEA_GOATIFICATION_6 [Gordonia phage GOATification]WNO27210.1 hypothetical protein SEA_FULCRUM_6 [Gordonia phage Fulcrum]
MLNESNAARYNRGRRPARPIKGVATGRVARRAITGRRKRK